MSYDNSNRFAIWPNDRKREGKQDADFTGELDVNGVKFWVNAWKRKPDAKTGAPSLSGTINRKEENRAPNPQSSGGYDAYDDIPM